MFIVSGKSRENLCTAQKTIATPYEVLFSANSRQFFRHYRRARTVENRAGSGMETDPLYRPMTDSRFF
jgi:hypothetical protein